MPFPLSRSFLFASLLALAHPVHSAEIEWENLGREPSVPPFFPEVRAVADLARDRVLVAAGAGRERLELWSSPLSHSSWERVAAGTGGPAALRGFSLTIDPARDRLLLYGGVRPDGGVSDSLWQLPLTGTARWSVVEIPGVHPAPRSWHTAVLDSARDRLLVFGGFTSDWSNDLWSLSLTGTPAWTELPSTDPQPEPRGFHVAVVDGTRDRLLLHGGRNRRVPALSDTWERSLSESGKWTWVGTTGIRPARYQHSAVLDAETGRLILFGGDIGDVTRDPFAALDLATGEWTTAGAPVRPISGQGVILDPMRRRMLVIGGNIAARQAWSLVLVPPFDRWSLFGPSAPLAVPSSTVGTSVTDTRRHRMLLFEIGALDSALTLWSFEPERALPWVRQMVAPDAHHGFPLGLAAAVYDSAADRVIGINGPELPVWWELNLSGVPRWQWHSPYPGPFVPAGPWPARRDDPSAIWDPIGRRVLLHGGALIPDGPNTGVTRRTWETWELATGDSVPWRLLAPETIAPPNRSAHVAVYDPLRHRMIVLGGTSSADPEGLATWALELEAPLRWVQLDPGTGPGPFSHGGAAWDPAMDALLLLAPGPGGLELWKLDLAARRWTRGRAGGEAPEPRNRFASAFDPWTRAALLHGGHALRPLDDSWRLKLDEPAPPGARVLALVALPSATRITWECLLQMGTRVVVERFDGTWTALATRLVPEDRRLEFLDDRAKPGEHYRYRLRLAGAGAAISGSETSADIPDRSTLAFYSTMPNPSPGSIEADLLVPFAAPLDFELFDLGGRRIRAWTVRPEAAGRQRIVITRQAAVPSGVYRLRARQGGHTTIARIAIVR